MHEATLYEKLPEQKVQCTACNWYCTILPNQTGICGVRKNIEGKLYLLVYGKAIAAHIDPIEKKPLFHFLPETEVFSIGTIGCNFACGFCQNWDISQSIRELKQEGKISFQETSQSGKLGDDWPPKKIVETCVQKQIPSIAYTYNEPVIFFEYAFDTAKLGHKKGLKNVFVSNGFESKEAIKKIHPFLDGINIDLKAFTEKFYQKTCKAKLEPVLKNIERVAKSDIWLEITTLLVPGENDSKKELQEIAEFIARQSTDIPWHVTAFHPDYKMLDKNTTTHEKLVEAVEIGKKTGLKFAYIGNILDTEHSSTYCPKCTKALIKRNYHSIIEHHIQKGKCEYCGEKIAGVWK
ncbi:AmmeMemoRadiSam system radical SAM enzyme [Candidatus Micrarchaeota archaeon]|nr:AmmeMemoRadiSam system radical SAM enzyme [Candidatus Micrarchaeota archaeon]MBU1930198.1 AmmeMemoRadiSam system radical SAM enzyme [Candidatus Micrarchaeota archaeon]